MTQEPRSPDLSPEAKRELLARLLREKAGRVDTIHPLSQGQRGLWMVHQLEPQSAAYNVAVAVRIASPLDPAALKRTFEMLLERHPSLRSTFEAAEGEPFQRIHARGDLPFDVRAAAGEDADAIRERLTQESRRPFDLVQGPLSRVTVFSRSEIEHYLLLVVHHIVFDGWSVGLMLNELFTLYQAATTGVPAALPPLTHQYADFVRWQADMLEGEEGRRLWLYWEGQLAGHPPPLDLPTDRPRPALVSPRGATQRGRIEGALAGAYREWLRGEGATLYMGTLALFQVLLHRYTGQPDILVGSPTAGRSRPEFERVIGYFVNPVVMRAQLGDNPTFRDHLARVKATTLGALKHADYPFPLLVQRLQPNRDASHTPLFQVMFNLLKPSQIGGATSVASTGSRPQPPVAELVPLPQQEGQFDLELDVIDHGDELETTFKYSTDLFDAATIERMQGHFRTLLTSALADPGARVSDLDLLTGEEKAQLEAWNQTEVAYPREASVHGLFEEQAGRTPDAPAVVFEDRSLSYRELDTRASRLAGHLAALGVGPDVLVAVCLERSLDLAVALLAVLKAGGAYVPLDPGYPRERLALMLEDSGAGVLLTEAATEPLFPEFNPDDAAPPRPKRVRVDQSPEGGAEGPPRPALSSSHLAYVLYTSGSTGRPKGVGVSHQAVVNFLSSMRLRPGLRADDVLLSVTTFSFDIFGLELYLPLVVGARVVLVGRDEAADGERLLARLRASGATVMQATPATWRLLIEAGWSGDGLAKALCGGEALPRDLALQLLERVPEVWNLYGPTETTIWSAIAKLTPEDAVISIGRPIANTRIHVLDGHMHPLPVGAAGELYIGGDGLARGYLHRPELTAERFVADPLASRPGSQLYRTGDLARWLPDGRLECLGRVDDQVKVRGFRIELGEIEAVLGTHPAIKVAVITAKDAGSGEKQLVAYMAHGSGNEPTVTELRNFLKARLPPHMVPSSFAFLDELPLTPNGKVDRKALALLDRTRTTGAEAYVAPRTPMEIFVADLWKEALGVERVSARDNFFDLGGHSLLAMKVIAKVEKKIGERLNPREMIYQTLEQFAAVCEERPPAGTASPQGLGSKLLGALKGAFDPRRPASE